MVFRRELSLLLINVFRQTQCLSSRCSRTFVTLVTRPSFQAKRYFFLAVLLCSQDQDHPKVNPLVAEGDQDPQERKHYFDMNWVRFSNQFQMGISCIHNKRYYSVIAEVIKNRQWHYRKYHVSYVVFRNFSFII